MIDLNNIKATGIAPAPTLGNAVMIHADWIPRMEGEIAKRDAVLRQALEALERYMLWETSDDAERLAAEAIAAIKATLNP